MRKLKLLAAAAIILSVATVVWTVVMVHAQGTNSTTIVVTITPSATEGGAPSVDKSSVTLNKGQNQQVEWTCAGGCDFTVDFSHPEGSPFSHNSFSGTNANPHAMSGPPNKVGTFKYSVTANGGTLDPQIIVH